MSSALRWCSDVAILPQVSANKSIFTNTKLEDSMDLLIDEHLYFLPLPRFSRNFQGPEPDYETIVKAAKLSLFADLGEDLQDKSLDSIHKLYEEWYPCLDFLRDPSADLEAQACVLCLLVIDAKSLKSLHSFTGKFKHLAFEELKRETGHFTTFLDMLECVSKHAKLNALRLKSDGPKVTLKEKSKDSIDSELVLKENQDAEKAKVDDIKKDLKKDLKKDSSENPDETWSSIKHLKSRGLLLPETLALAQSRLFSDADDTYSAVELYDSMYVSNIVEENPDFAYKLKHVWTIKRNGSWQQL